jgi:hypothetical protein
MINPENGYPGIKNGKWRVFMKKQSAGLLIAVTFFSMAGNAFADDDVQDLLQGEWRFYGRNIVRMVSFDGSLIYFVNNTQVNKIYNGFDYQRKKIIAANQPDTGNDVEFPLIIIDTDNIILDGISYHRKGNEDSENRLISVANGYPPETLNNQKYSRFLIGYWKSVMGTNKAFVFFEDGFVYNRVYHAGAAYTADLIRSKDPGRTFRYKYYNDATIEIEGEVFNKELDFENSSRYAEQWKLYHNTGRTGPIEVYIE